MAVFGCHSFWSRILGTSSVNVLCKYKLFKARNARTVTRSVSSLPRKTITLDTDVETQLQVKSFKHRQHPGVMKLPQVMLPPKLVESVAILLQDSSISDLEKQAVDVVNYLTCRKPPVENREIRIRANQLEREMLAAEGIDMRTLSPEMRDVVKENLQRKIQERLKYTMYHWKQITYDRHQALLYLVGKLAPDYAALMRILNEIRQRDPTYRPETVFDFGSGVGSALWAVTSSWPVDLKEYFAVDTSGEMNDVSNILLRGGNANKESIVKNVFFRQFLPATHQRDYGLVFSAYSLLELPSAKSRLMTVDSLWKKTRDYLVIVECGTKAGFEIVAEARDFLLQTSEESIHVFAPCPHEKKCPRLNDGTDTPCHFEVKYTPLSLKRSKEVTSHSFTYVVLKKGPRTVGTAWPRIVRPMLPRPRHAVCRLCTDRGSLEEVIVTTFKHGKSMYRCARASNWGDLLPSSIQDPEDTGRSSDSVEDLDEEK